MYYKTAGYASHVPTIVRLMRETEGPVIEFGSGFFSTPILHELCEMQGRELVSLETAPKWRKRLSAYETEWHRFPLIDGWDDPKVDEVVKEREWGLCLLDHVPGKKRAEDLLKMRRHAKVVMLHSSKETPIKEALKEFDKALHIQHIRPWPSVIVSDFLDVDTLALFRGSVQVKDFFERIYVINLRDREDRWKAFQKRMGEIEWPFDVEPQRFEAVDGRVTGFPPGWKQGGGAWGCLQSHVRILEECIQDNVRSVLILEDDAVFKDDFAVGARRFLEAVPGDWKHIYLGGQHLRQPTKEKDGWVRCINVNRTHAHGFRDDYMKEVYAHITDLADYSPKHHVDHRLGVLTARQRTGVYAPEEWLVGQGGGHSNIAGKKVREKWWNGQAQKPIAEGTGVAVVGCFRSGTSIVAGMLHKLGVHMGNQFQPPAKWAPTGTYEAAGLKNLMRKAYKDRTKLLIHRDELSYELASFMEARKREADEKGTIAGFKHPSMCMCMDRILELWAGELKVVAVDRPLGEIFTSWSKLAWAPEKGQKLQAIIEAHQKAKEAAIRKVKRANLLRVRLKDVRANPTETVDGLIHFLGIEATSKQRLDAINLVLKPGEKGPK